MFLNGLTIVVLILLVVVAGVIVVTLGTLPAKIAREREHPQAEAINVMSWLGVITLGLLWPIALIWAYTRSPYTLQAGAGSGDGAADDEITGLTARVESLEEQIRQLGAT